MDVAQFGDTELSLARLKSSVEKLRQRDNGQTKTRLEEEFNVRVHSVLEFSSVLLLFHISPTALSFFTENLYGR